MWPDDTSVVVLVVSYGSHQLLATNLLVRSKVVVVDNFTNHAERSSIRSLAAERGWEVLVPATNLGFGGGCNLAAEYAVARGADVLLFVNPDAVIDDTAIEALAAAVAADRSAMVAPTVYRPDGSLWAGGTYDLDLATGLSRSSHRRAGVPASGEVQPWLSGACFAMSAELWQLTGGFDEDYFLYWEDVDLSRKVIANGGRLALVDGVSVVHQEGGTHSDSQSGNRAKSGTYYYYSTRNRLLFAAKNLSDRDRRRWRRSAWRAAQLIVLEGGRRQLLTSLTPWRAAISGTLAGLRLSRRSCGGS